MTLLCDKPGLRTWFATHIGKKFRDLSGNHENELFFECEIDKIKNLTLKNCCLSRSRFITKKAEDALGFTLTLDCNSFSNVEYSPELFDLILVLLTKTKGNVDKRKALIDIVGRERFIEILRELSTLES